MSSLRDFLGIVAATVSIFASGTQAIAIGYYVDYVGGADSNVGTNPATAWQHCPGDAVATGVAASTPLNPGDTVYFKGGVRYVFTAPYTGPCVTPGIQLYWNGTSGAPITYASTNTWGDGSRAIFTDNYAANDYVAFWNYYGASNLVFNNLEIGPMGGAAALPVDRGTSVPANPAWGMYFDGSVDNVTIENCYFHSLGYWFNQQPMSSDSIQGGCISSGGITCQADLNGLVVTNCEFTQMHTGVEILYGATSSNLAVAGCNFHDYIVWSIDLAGPITGGSGISLNNVFISANQFHDFDWSYAPFYWAGYGGPPHHDGIYLRPQSADAGSNIDIYNNTFWGTHTNASGTAAIWAASSSANIYNNLIVNCNSLANGDYSGTLPIDCSAGADAPSKSPSLMRVLNNTIIVNTAADLDNGQSTEALYMGCDGSETWPAKDTLIVENNIFYDFRTSIYGTDLVGTDPMTSGPNGWTFDYNDYSTVLPALFQISGVNSGLNLGGLQAIGWESNGQSNDPQFVSLVNSGGTGSWQNNYALTSGSPCISAGANLSSLNLPGLNADIQGNPRPTSGPWDIGAYEYNTNSVPPPERFALPAVALEFTNVVQTCKTKTKIDHTTGTTNYVTTCRASFEMVASNNGATNFPAFHVLFWTSQGSVFDPSMNPRPVTKKVKALRENETTRIRLTLRFNGNQAGTFLYATDTNNNVLASAQIPEPE